MDASRGGQRHVVAITEYAWRPCRLTTKIVCYFTDLITFVLDGYGSHLCGLNFSRAYNYAEICIRLLTTPALSELRGTQTFSDLIILLRDAAVKHFRFATPTLASGHFMGDHWLASFAMRALESIQLLLSIQ